MGLCLACLEAQVDLPESELSATEAEAARELQQKQRRPSEPVQAADPRYYQAIIDDVQSKFINLSLFQAHSYADEQDELETRNSIKLTEQKIAASKNMLAQRPPVYSAIDTPEKATDVLTENPDLHLHETLASQFAAIASSHAYAVIGDNNDPAVIILSSRPQQVTA